VVFADPGEWLPPAAPPDDGPVRHAVRSAMTFVGLLPADSGEHLIKRVIGMSGDRVVCCDQQGRITVNGRAITEPYLYPGVRPSDLEFDITVPAGSLWVMGDHRSVSEDSRFHQQDPRGGTVPVRDVVGKAFVIVWPFSRAEPLSRPAAAFARVPDAG
jgi:signal peptidase I